MDTTGTWVRLVHREGVGYRRSRALVHVTVDNHAQGSSNRLEGRRYLVARRRDNRWRLCFGMDPRGRMIGFIPPVSL